MIDAWLNFKRISSINYFFSGSILFAKIREKVWTSVDTFASRATLRIQISEILDCTVLKTNISAFRKVLRHQNRFTSQRERNKNVRFIGFWSKSTLGSQIRLNLVISSPSIGFFIRDVRHVTTQAFDESAVPSDSCFSIWLRQSSVRWPEQWAIKIVPGSVSTDGSH